MSATLTSSIDLFSTRKPAGVASVALRQIRPDDAAALQAFVRALLPASRRLRFHMALNELTESALRALTRVDQRAHVAFVLTTTERGAERIVGEARYVVSCDKETAEFAIAVAEGFRGLGLAERLMTALIGAARAAGLRWLIGEVLAGNARMLALRAVAALPKRRAVVWSRGWFASSAASRNRWLSRRRPLDTGREYHTARSPVCWLHSSLRRSSLPGIFSNSDTDPPRRRTVVAACDLAAGATMIKPQVTTPTNAHRSIGN
jgi:GNAT superfamily N-acetyltransferase